MSRLAEIYKQEKKSGGGLGSAVTKRMGEKIDPRQMLDASGVIATMFPGLKPYSATKQKTPSATSSMPSISSGSGELSLISEATKITAKNTLAMPAMARDMHLVKQNIIKLVKSSGGKPQTKSGDFFNRQQARESAFEGKMGALGKLGGSIGASNLTSILGKKKDGQSPGSALFVKESKGLVPDVEDMLPSLLKGFDLPAMRTAILAALGPLLLAGAGLALLGGLIFAVMKIAKAKGSFADEEEGKAIDDIAKTGGLAGQKDEQDRRKKLSEYERTKLDIADYEKNMNEGQKLGEMQLAGFAKRGSESAKAVDEYKKANNIGQTPSPTPASAAPPAAPSAVPNQVTSGSGAPVMTGAGVPLTSGDGTPFTTVSPSPAAPATSTTPTKSTTPAGSGPSDGLINFLKQKENPALAQSKGTSKAFWDYKQYSIGYGTKASGPDEMITEAEADKRLRDEISKSYQYVASYAKQKGYNWDQGKMDALASFVYNLGPGQLKNLTNDGKRTDAEIAQALPLYNKAGGKVLAGLEKRRTAELGMFTGGGGAPGGGGAVMVASSPTGTAPSSGGGGGATLAAAAPPSTGSTVASASSSVADGRQSGGGGGSVVVDNSQRTTMAAAPTAGKPASAYDKDIVDALMGSTYA
jgi:GH24 family phage-related lysozyme (muramidase)